MSTPKPSLWSLSLVFAMAALSGCIGGDAGADSHLYVKDALTDDVSNVHVTFTKAQVKAVDGGWITIFEGKQSIDLLSFSAADAMAALSSFSLAPGDYEGLRIAVSEVEVTHLDGSKELLNVYGNLVQVADDFSVGADGIDILVDFDLEQGVDLLTGTYTPVVSAVQTSDDDADDDGLDDVHDDDDDGDGIRDDRDDDDDGDGEDDHPRQHHGEDEAELCEAEEQDDVSDAQADLNESLAKAQAEYDHETADAQADYDEEVAKAAADRDEELSKSDKLEDQQKAWSDYNASVAQAQADYDHETADAQADFDKEVAEAYAHYDEKIAEAGHHHDECGEDDSDDHEDDHMDESEDDHEDTEDDSEDDS